VPELLGVCASVAAVLELSLADCDAETDWLAVPVSLLVGGSVWVELPLSLGDCETLLVGGGVCVEEPLSLGDDETLGVDAGVCEPVPLLLGLPDGVPDPLPDCETDGVAAALPLIDAVTLLLALTLAEFETLCDGVAPADRVVEGDGDAVTLADGVMEPVRDGETVLEGVAEGEGPVPRK